MDENENDYDLDSLSSRHRKESKALEGERRAALKKAKGTAGKGKKAKELLAKIEAEYDEKERTLKEQHAKQMADYSLTTRSNNNNTTNDNNNNNNNITMNDNDTNDSTTTTTTTINNDNTNNTNDSPQLSKEQEQEKQQQAKIEQKRQKKRLQKQKQKLKQLQKQEEIERETAQAMPTSAREMELQALSTLYLEPLRLKVVAVKSDGNCLYRAVAEQCGEEEEEEVSHLDIRSKCADVLLAHAQEFEPFCDLQAHHVDTFDAYVERVRNSSDWGGQVELRALAMGLERPVVVYSADAPPVLMGEEFDVGGKNKKKILLSYHKHYYALGEHYNKVVPINENDDEDDNEDNVKQQQQEEIH